MLEDGVSKVPYLAAGSLNVYERSLLRKKPWPLAFVQRSPALLDEHRKTPNCRVVP
jgi:hypothetical protein